MIVGANRGIGACLAKIYRENGWKVDELNRDRCELSDPVSVTKILADASINEAGYDLCIFSAGVAEAGYIDQLDANAYRRCIEVNFLAPVAIFSALARAKKPCRRFVFMLTGVGEFLVPGMSPYALSKRVLGDFLKVVRMERSFDDAQILAVWPGYVLTQFKSRIRLHGEFRLPGGIMARQPELVARKIYEAERKDERRLVLSPIPNTLGWIQKICPFLMNWLISLHPNLRRSK